MTDDELKQLVASLAIAQKKTDEQLAKTDAQLAETDRSIAKLSSEISHMREEHDRTDAKINKLAKMYGGVANNQGDVAEEFYYNSFKHNPALHGIRYDYVDKNVTRNHQGTEDEFDVLLLNGKDVFIIEVKYKAHASDLERLINKKAANFRKLFPAYSKHKHHLGLASFHMNDELKELALAQGVTVLQRKGDVVETFAA